LIFGDFQLLKVVRKEGLSKAEAMEYLHNNRERLIKDGTYEKIENLLDK
jgi:hypothetical protein